MYKLKDSLKKSHIWRKRITTECWCPYCRHVTLIGTELVEGDGITCSECFRDYVLGKCRN